jgi:hypothetical protein
MHTLMYAYLEPLELMHCSFESLYYFIPRKCFVGVINEGEQPNAAYRQIRREVAVSNSAGDLSPVTKSKVREQLWRAAK